MDIDVDQRAVDLTNFLFKTPSYRSTAALLFLASFAFGVAARLALGKGETAVETFLYGGTDGILVLAVPALVSSMLATFFFSRKEFRRGFKYFSFIAFVSVIIYALVVLFGTVVGKTILTSVSLSSFVILGNAIVLVMWLTSTWIVLAYKRKALFICLLHPLANLAFIVLWNKFAVIESIALESTPISVFKLGIASIILLIALIALVFIINAPTKRNFGISTIDTVTMFFAQWVSGSKGLEEILAGTGEKITTQVGTLTFTRGEEIKAAFVVPQIHYGPIGNLGGSEFPGLLSTNLSQTLAAPVFVFKGTANHDFDPVYSDDVKVIQKAAENGIRSERQTAKTAAFLEGREGYSHVFGLEVKNTAFLTLSRAPKNCEDIHQALGRALRNKVLSLGFKEALLVDRHNCKVDGVLFGPGSTEYNEYEKAVENMNKYRGALHLGTGESHKEFSPDHGIGKGGLKAAVFKIKNKTACFVVVDANNCVPSFRNELVERIKQKHGFYFVDLLTTDSHAVNSISGIHNPLGERIDKKEFIEEVEKTVAAALKDVEPCSASAFASEVEIEVLGPQRSSELVITVNSIFAVLKILAPIIFIASIILAFLALVMI